MNRFVIAEPDKCIGCRTCEIACVLAHPTGAENDLTPENFHPRLKVVKGLSMSAPVQCHHCENAPCVKICPTNAMTTKGVKTEDCIGCGLCSIVCPFGAITIAESVAEKCDLCADREEGPACVKACTKRAISVIDPAKIKIKNQEKYLAKLAGEYDIGSTSNRSFVHFITSAARARLALDE